MKLKVYYKNRADNSQLVRAKDHLQQVLQPAASTNGMTQQSAQNYNAKRQAAEQAIQNAANVINNGDATAQQITEAKIELTKPKESIQKLKII